MQKIAIDSRMYNSAGVGTYLKNLLNQYAKLDHDFGFRLIGNPSELREYSYNNNFEIIENDAGIYTLREQIKMPASIGKVNLLHCPHYNIPIQYKGKLVVTIHDVCHLAMPQFVRKFHQKVYAKAMLLAATRKADIIITDSEFSKNEIMKYVKVNPNKIRTLYLGVDSDFRVSSEKENYILYVGNVKPHKNLKRALQAYSLLLKKGFDCDFIIVGKREGFITEDDELNNITANISEKVIFTGYVSDGQVKEYFRKAILLIFPSLYEGFGLPPLEAMASGTPVVVSNAASLPEIVGNAGVYVDPYDVESIFEGMCKVLSDIELRKELVQKGLARVKGFSWRKTAEKTLDIYNYIVL